MDRYGLELKRLEQRMVEKKSTECPIIVRALLGNEHLWDKDYLKSMEHTFLQNWSYTECTCDECNPEFWTHSVELVKTFIHLAWLEIDATGMDLYNNQGKLKFISISMGIVHG